MVHFKYSEFLSPAPTPSELCVLSFRTVIREKKGKPEKSKELVEETELFVCVCVFFFGGGGLKSILFTSRKPGLGVRHDLATALV